MEARPAFLQQGEPARLIPVGSASAREANTTSALLACLTSVEEFGRAMLEGVGVRTGARSRITCYTEVVFKNAKAPSDVRPDGLICLHTGRQTRYFLVETKVGNEELNPEQVGKYVELAREFDVEAVITISNQFAPLPTHHPIQVDKRKLGNIGLYHWSWVSLLTEAMLLAEHKGVSDPDQAFILRELIRYLQHKSSGAVNFDSMGRYWKDVCTALYAGQPLSTSDTRAVNVVSDWHQLVRYLSLQMRVKLGTDVTIHLSRSEKMSPEERLKRDLRALSTENRLEADLEIPDAASNLHMVVDFRRRACVTSMHLKAPGDRQRPSAHMTWILGQLLKATDLEIMIRVNWPGKAPSTSATLAQLRENKDAAVPDGARSAPASFDVVRVYDLGKRFGGSRTFVEEMEKAIPSFYYEVGQHLKAWVASAPKAETKEPVGVFESGGTASSAHERAKESRPPDKLVVQPDRHGNEIYDDSGC